jgi:hypothetical protein
MGLLTRNSGDQATPVEHPVANMTVFLSYAREDEERVRQLAGELESLGLQVAADWKIPTSVPWKEHLRGLIISSELFVFCISGSAIESDSCLHELGLAEQCNKRIAPVVFESVDEAMLRPSLRDPNWIVPVQLEMEKALSH